MSRTDDEFWQVVFAKIVCVLVLAVGVVTIVWAWSRPFEACEVMELSENIKLALSGYSDAVRQVFTLSTALVGLGAAILLGFREVPKLNKSGQILTLASVACFVFAAYFALLWQTWLAQLHFNGCPNLVTGMVMQIPYIAYTNFFAGGLVLIAAVVFTVVFGRPAKNG